MYRYFFAFISLWLIVIGNTGAQSPVWEWSKSGQGKHHDWVRDMVIDHSGNCLITGTVSSDTIIFDGVTLTTPGPFVVKYSPVGDVLWAKSYYHGDSNSITVDENNNIYFTGFFNLATIQFDTTVLYSAGQSDIFLTKLDSSGNVIWAKSKGSIQADMGTSVVTDPGGYVYLGGSNKGTIIFGYDTLNIPGAFIAKYDNLGNALWAKSINGDLAPAVIKIALDQNGELLVAGHFNGNYMLAGNDTLFNLSGGSTDIFIIKFDVTGNVVWANSIGGYNYDYLNDMIVSPGNEIYLTGSYRSMYFVIDSINTVNAFQGYSDIFILKYSSNGNFIWVRTVGGIGGDAGQSMAIDSADNLFVTGIFTSPAIDFGNSVFYNSIPLESKSFVVKYSSTGNDLWGLVLGDSKDVWTKRIRMNNDNQIYLTGTFNGSILNVGSNILPGNSNNTHTIFTAKIGDLNTSVASINDLQDISVYPNPGTGKFTVKNSHNDNLIITLQTLSEQILQHFESSDSYIGIDLTPHQAGVYMLRIQSGMKVVRIEKIVVY